MVVELVRDVQIYVKGAFHKEGTRLEGELEDGVFVFKDKQGIYIALFEGEWRPALEQGRLF